MRRLNFVLTSLGLATLLVASGACNRKPAQVETVEEEGSQVSSVIHVADPRAGAQLLKGFHDVEGNAWRWTKSKFTVTLKTPMDAATRGATLELKFSFPDSVFSKVGPTTLTSSLNGVALEPETFSKPGEQTYKREVPASALGGETVTIDFALDKFLAAGQVEQRELGIIVSSIGLSAK